MVSDKEKKKVLITGGAGFIGSIIKDKLKQTGHEVLSIGRNSKEDYKIDLLDPALKETISKFSPQVVCHFASGTNIARAEQNKDQEFKDTVVATQGLIEAVGELESKVEKFIYLSSQAVYGIPKELPIAETHDLDPYTFYGKNKLITERIIAESKINHVIFRVSSVYGFGQDYSKSGVIAKFIKCLQSNRAPIVYNSLDSFSDFIHVEDVVSAIIAVLERSDISNEAFNLGSNKATTLKEVLDVLYKYFKDSPSPIIQANNLYLNNNHKGIYLSTKKIQEKLNWMCKYDIQTGLSLMLEGQSHIAK